MKTAAACPPSTQGDTPKLVSAEHTQHFTEPPPRYSEASLVKKLEELGIGRPSTYASTLSTLIDRDYVRLDQKRFIPEDNGRLVTIFLEKFFARYVEYDFTAELEEKLDLVSDGKLDVEGFPSRLLEGFQRRDRSDGELRVTNVIDALNEVLEPHIFPPKTDENGNKVDPRKCPNCGDGQLSLKLGKFGAFVGCSNYPECRFTRPFGAEQNGQSDIPPDGKPLGNNPEGVPVYSARPAASAPTSSSARPGDKSEKPRRSSIPQRLAGGGTRPRTGAEAALAAARSRQAPGGWRADRSPTSAAMGPMCSTSRPTPTCRTSTSCSRSASTAPSR